MYSEITIDELFEEAEFVKNFIIVKDFERYKLIDLSNKLKDVNKVLEEVYWLDGNESFGSASFKSIKHPHTIVVKGKDLCSKSGGLIFPQTKPIILVIENFDKLETEDQKNYAEQICKREPTDYLPNNYLHEDSVVILSVPSSFAIPRFSYKVQLRVIKN